MTAIERQVIEAPSAQQAAPKLDLRGIFAPRSVAIVGASDDRSRFGGKVLQRLLQFGWKGQVFAVNPKAATVQGVKSYPSLHELPVPPEHVGLAVPTASVFSVLEDCAAIGVKFVTLFAAGFAETGTEEGRRLQKQVSDFAQRSGIRIVGPNCNGLVNFIDRFALTSSGTVAGPDMHAGNIGLVAQSGGAAQVNVMWRAQELGLGLSYEVSCGNCADLDLLDFIEFMLDDPHTDVVMALAEDLKSGEKFIRVASRAAEVRKPIVILKLGRTEAGSRAAASHTGAMTGSDAVHDAVFRQYGVIRVNDCNELYETAMMLRSRKFPSGHRAAALSISGGNAVLVADSGARLGISWPDYSTETQEKLTKLLPRHGRASNPTDLTNASVGQKDVYRQCVETLAADDNVDAVIPILTMAVASDVAQAVDAAKNATKLTPLLWTGGCSDNRELGPKQLIRDGLAVYRDATSCLRTLKSVMDYSAFLRRRHSPDHMRRGSQPASTVVVDEALTYLKKHRATLGEHASKKFLSACGFPITREFIAENADRAAEAARSIGGPVAVKVASDQIPHKTDAGAVRLRLQGDDAVRKAFAEVMTAAHLSNPSAELEGALVQEMARDDGLEMIIGVATDATFGPVLMAGLGGIHTEIFRDVAFRVPPIDEAEALAMLKELRAFPLLEGARGQRRRDIARVCSLLTLLSRVSCDAREYIAELDINPLMVYAAGHGACVVDAMISLHDPQDRNGGSVE